MSISLETQWVLVTSGLIAHADGVLDAEECDRLLRMIDDDLDGETYAQWFARIGKKDELEHMLAELQTPDTGQTREILEQAWAMAMVDGERSPLELEMLQTVAERLGVDAMQLEYWREAWSRADREYAECTLLAAMVIVGEAAGRTGALDDVAWSLAVAPEQRDALLQELTSHDVGAVVPRIAALSRARRVQLFEAMLPVVRKSGDAGEARKRLLELAEASGSKRLVEPLLATG